MSRWVCIHGHFYQPPRENAWLEAIELQDSARPFHDWNERITAECYGPNGAARILDGAGHIERLVDNYERMSFNFGPTLLRWLDEKEPDVHAAILAADRRSRERFGGRGSAMAQGFHHVILPLCNERDLRTQVRWAVEDFEHRFERPPEGIWLPETAASTATLEAVAEAGFRFTVLAPGQAGRVRRIGERQWHDVSGGHVDPRRAYLTTLPSGRQLSLFFYDGPVSQGIAFEGILRRGEDFAARLLSVFDEESDEPQIVHVATDGETYGHHHRHGEMALAHALEILDARDDVRLTNYSHFLDEVETTWEAEIVDDTSWSCAHGVERWRSDCGCHTGGEPGWTQAWRAPLRTALDHLRDELAPAWEQEAGRILRDPWAARDEYVEVVLDRSPERVDIWLDGRATRDLEPQDRIHALELLELQRHALLMYTSCGWFFSELSGIETVQVLQYAARVLELARERLGLDLEESFLELLAEAPSNVPEHRNGRVIFETMVRPARVDLPAVAAHYAISSAFEKYADRQEVFCYTVDREGGRILESGRAKLVVGRATIASAVTRRADRFDFGVLHFGDHDLTAGVRRSAESDDDRELLDEATSAFERADLAGCVRILDRYFEGLDYSLRSLFRDEQRKLLDEVLRVTLADAESAYREIYERNEPLMRYLADLKQPLPAPLAAAAELVLHLALRRELESAVPSAETIRGITTEAGERSVKLSGGRLSLFVERALERTTRAFHESPEKTAHLELLLALDGLRDFVDIPTEPWRLHSVTWHVMNHRAPELRERAAGGDAAATAWVDVFDALARRLRFL